MIAMMSAIATRSRTIAARLIMAAALACAAACAPSVRCRVTGATVAIEERSAQFRDSPSSRQWALELARGPSPSRSGSDCGLLRHPSEIQCAWMVVQLLESAPLRSRGISVEWTHPRDRVDIAVANLPALRVADTVVRESIELFVPRHPFHASQGLSLAWAPHATRFSVVGRLRVVEHASQREFERSDVARNDVTLIAVSTERMSFDPAPVVEGPGWRLQLGEWFSSRSACEQQSRLATRQRGSDIRRLARALRGPA